MSRTIKLVVLFTSLVLGLLLSQMAEAQLPYYQSFKDTSTPGLILAGAAKLTAKTVDAPGSGYLRLTDTFINQVGCVYAEDSFPSSLGIIATFEFFTYTRAGTSSADGFSFFLFDAGINAFRAGPTGGSLGYAQKFSTPGLGKGYIGVGIDEFGNFSVAGDGNKSGGTASKVKPAVVIRGPGNGATTTDYPYITGVQTDVSPHTTPFHSFSQRFPDSSQANYRRIKIIMKPGSSLGSSGYKVTIVMYKGAGTAGVPVISDTLINSYDYPYIAPAKLQYGLIGSTGSVFAFHEIRNMRLEAYSVASLTAPVLNNDTANVCSGNSVLVDLTANDASTNSGGIINKSSLDLDPAVTGIQTTYIDPGKGSYQINTATGIVTFSPDVNFTGTSLINYTAKDNYGAAATTNGTVVVNVTSGSALTLAITDPPGICGSGTVSITAPAVTAGSTTSAAYSYYNTLSDAEHATNNINSIAGGINVPGTYYIRADKGGCASTRPVTVIISQAPSTAVAGNTQTICVNSSLQVNLQANSPAIGTGAWSQVSGPAVSIALPISSNTPVQLPAVTGSYGLRWTISNGVCPASTSIVTVNVSDPGTTATAGAIILSAIALPIS